MTTRPRSAAPSIVAPQVRQTIVAWALFLSACGPAVIELPDVTPEEAIQAEIPVPVLSEGACGGFTGVELGAPVSLLRDRVRVAPLEVPAPHWIENWHGDLSILSRELDGQVLSVEASELYRTVPEGDLAVAIASLSENAEATIAALATADGEVIVAFLPPPEEEDEALDEEEEEEEFEDEGDGLVPLLDAYVTTRDRSLVRMRVKVSPAAYAEGGCERIAVTIAEATARGGRSLEARSGDRALWGGFAVSVPPLTVIEDHDMIHWREHHLHVVTPLDEERTPFMMIRFDGHPGRPDVNVPTATFVAPVLGHDVDWRTWVTDTGYQWRDVIVPGGPLGNVWIAIGGDTPESLAQLTAIAGSLEARAVDHRLAGCDTVASAPPAPELSLPPSSPAVNAIRILQEATELHTATPAPAFDAMRTIFRLPAAEGAAAFRQLVEQGTPAGRVYGLTGLYYLAASDFDAIACASREALSAPIQVADRCGVRAHPGLELLEASGPDTAFTVQDIGAIDLRSGGLPRRIFEQVFEGYAPTFEGDGWVPPLEAGAAAPPALAPGDARAPRSIRMIGSTIRWTTRDGRVAETAGREAPRYVSESDVTVRYPVDQGGSRDVRCVLDANGRRACGGSIVTEALAQRERECGVAVPSTVPYRVFDDGPWAELVDAHGVCGIRADDRSLHCFLSGDFQRTWGATPGPGLFGAYRMPIEGRVIGVFDGDIHSQPAFYASTEDGAVYQWTLNDPPRVIHRFDGPVDSVAQVERVVFVTLRDGRVFARGLRSVSEWWFPGGRENPRGAFEEIEALRGARIFPDERQACLLDAEQRVRCWGNFMDGALGSAPAHEYRQPPPEITAYRGATELFVSSSTTCARMGDMQLLCAAEDVARRLPGQMRNGYLSIDLDRLRPRPAATR